MNKIYTILCFLFCNLLASGQNGGLEKIIVEKYYISDANDMANTTGGIVPIGSTTYRIYVDMLPGYIFQAAYGVPLHELRIETSTAFFNNEDRGGTTPRYTKTQARNNTVMLDSWLSVGAGCTDFYGIQKTEDNGLLTIVNKDGVLKNNLPEAGIPLTEQDGLLEGFPEEVTMVGITSEVSVFDDLTSGGLFSVFDGSWASLNGSVGPDTAKNVVLIGQMTTDGKFSFELNIQIRSSNFVVEQYVAKDPIGDEKSIPSLIYPIITDSKNVSNEHSIGIICPNPANDFIVLNMPNLLPNTDLKYSIYNTSGNVLFQDKLNVSTSNQSQKIDISNLPVGMYLLSVSLEGVSEYLKFVKI